MGWICRMVTNVFMLALSGTALSLGALAACHMRQIRKNARVVCALLKCAALGYLIPAVIPAGDGGGEIWGTGGLRAAFVKTVFVIWCAGAAIFLALRIFSRRRAKHALRARVPVRREEYILMERLCGELGIRRKVHIYRCYGILSPCVCGIWKPKIFLPVMPFKQEQLEMVLYHELLHVMRRDLFWKTLLAVICIVFWFIPFPRLLLAALCRWSEAGCDALCCRRFCARPYFEMMGELLVRAGDCAPECVCRCAGGMEEFRWRVACTMGSVRQEK